MPRNNATTTQRPNGRYFFRTRKPVNYVEEDQPDNKNDPDYNPDEIREYWVRKNRTNKLLHQTMEKLQTQSNYTEPVSLISNIIDSSSSHIVTRSNKITQSHPQSTRYSLRRR